MSVDCGSEKRFTRWKWNADWLCSRFYCKISETWRENWQTNPVIPLCSRQGHRHSKRINLLYIYYLLIYLYKTTTTHISSKYIHFHMTINDGASIAVRNKQPTPKRLNVLRNSIGFIVWLNAGVTSLLWSWRKHVNIALPYTAIYLRARHWLTPWHRSLLSFQLDCLRRDTAVWRGFPNPQSRLLPCLLGMQIHHFCKRKRP